VPEPELSDRYDGPFEPNWSIDRLSRTGLARLCREVMLISMLHDRALMPHVTGRGGAAAAVAQADDEWMSSSPIYTARNKANLQITGDGVDAVLKSFQFDVGTPHHFLDMQGEVVDHDLGYFWLTSCGAHDYVSWVSGNDEKIVSMMCHDMEDRTFDATLRATNPRARCTPVHRPPKPDAFTGEPCRWEVTIASDEVTLPPEHPNLEILRATRAATHQLVLGSRGEPGGLDDYSGPYRSGLRLDDFSHAVLVRQVAEFELDIHLLMRAAYLSVQQRHGDEVLSQAATDHLAALIPPLVARLASAMGVTGDGPSSIAKLLQLNPLLPLDYVDQRVELIDGEVEIAIRPCAALDDRGTPSPIDTIDADDPVVVSAFARAVNPCAQIRRIDAGRWRIWIDPAAPPAAPHPMADLVGGHNYFPAQLGPRPVAVAIASAPTASPTDGL
jgi:hypothetical protein